MNVASGPQRQPWLYGRCFSGTVIDMARRCPVLVVDDDLAIREGLVELLAEAGFAVASAANGAEALTLLRTLDPRPCLVLLDLMMPIMDGETFRAEQVRDRDIAAVPVVVMSASPNARTVATTNMAAAAFLPKPVSFDSILLLAQQHCGG